MIAAHQTMLAPHGGPSSLDYVQDSAFLFFDGIENAGRKSHTNTPGTWTNLAGGPDASPVSSCNATWKTDALAFAETGAYDIPLSGVTWPTGGMTIEIAYRWAQYGSWAGRIICSGFASYGRIDFYNPGSASGNADIGWGAGAFKINSLTKAPPTYATVAIRGYANQTGVSVRVFGSTQTISTSQYPRYKQSYLRVGNVPDMNRGFLGDVCAIRVHSRQLTDAEVDANAALDRQRFGVT